MLGAPSLWDNINKFWRKKLNNISCCEIRGVVRWYSWFEICYKRNYFDVTCVPVNQFDIFQRFFNFCEFKRLHSTRSIFLTSKREEKRHLGCDYLNFYCIATIRCVRSVSRKKWFTLNFTALVSILFHKRKLISTLASGLIW